MSALPEDSVVSSIRVRTGKGGQSRVFIVQTRNRAEVSQVEQLFEELEEYCSVRALSSGVTTSFAVQTRGELPVLQEVEQLLKEHFKFSVVYGGFNPVIHRIVEDLALETGSRLFAVPTCQSCGEMEPFPVRLSFHGPGGKARARALFCNRCVASAEGEGEAEDLCRLAGSDHSDLTTTPATSVVRKRSLLHYRFGRKRHDKSEGGETSIRGGPLRVDGDTDRDGDTRMAG